MLIIVERYRDSILTSLIFMLKVIFFLSPGWVHPLLGGFHKMVGISLLNGWFTSYNPSLNGDEMDDN